MIYRFTILAESGLYDGWAHNEGEMKTKYMAQAPNEDEPYVFLAGSAPQVLTYKAYTVALERGLSPAQISVVDAYLLEHEVQS